MCTLGGKRREKQKKKKTWETKPTWETRPTWGNPTNLVGSWSDLVKVGRKLVGYRQRWAEGWIWWKMVGSCWSDLVGRISWSWSEVGWISSKLVGFRQSLSEVGRIWWKLVGSRKLVGFRRIWWKLVRSWSDVVKVARISSKLVGSWSDIVKLVGSGSVFCGKWMIFSFFQVFKNFEFVNVKWWWMIVNDAKWRTKCPSRLLCFSPTGHHWSVSFYFSARQQPLWRVSFWKAATNSSKWIKLFWCRTFVEPPLQTIYLPKMNRKNSDYYSRPQWFTASDEQYFWDTQMGF